MERNVYQYWIKQCTQFIVLFQIVGTILAVPESDDVETQPLTNISALSSSFGRSFNTPKFIEKVKFTQSPTYLSYWLKNHDKYLIALQNLHDKILKKGTEMDIPMPDDPWALLGTPCQPEVWQTITNDFLASGEPLHVFSKKVSASSTLTGSCLYPERLPVLECDKVTSTCICLNASHTPYHFVPVNSTTQSELKKQCLGVEGSVCEGDFTEEFRIKKINCFPGIRCNTEVGVCGGIVPLMENAFAGEEVSFTPQELLQAAKSEGGIENFLLELQMKDTIPIGSPCNFTQWKRNAGPYLAVIESIDLDGPFYDALNAVLEMRGINGTLATSMFDVKWNDTDAHTRLCLDYFPSMVCTKARGSSTTDSCVCGRLKGMFNYTEVKGFCLAGLDTICTTIHGPVRCVEAADKNIQCSDYVTEHQKVKHYEIATQLTAFELKVCGDQLPANAHGNITERRPLNNLGVMQAYFPKMLFLLVCLWMLIYSEFLM